MTRSRTIRALLLALLLTALLAPAAALASAAGGPPPLATALLQFDPNADMSTYALWLAFLAIASSVASSLVLYFPTNWSHWRKRGVVALFSLLLSLGSAFYEGRLDITDWSRTWIIIFLSASGFYVVISKPLGSLLKQGTAPA